MQSKKLPNSLVFDVSLCEPTTEFTILNLVGNFSISF